MIKITVSKQSNYPVSSVAIKRALVTLFSKKGIVSDTQCDVAIVGKAKMLSIAKRYLKEKSKKPHSVLSFTASETKKEFLYPPDGKIYLGEIIICYPEVVEQAKKKAKKIDEMAIELVEHGALHLLGIHHN